MYIYVWPSLVGTLLGEYRPLVFFVSSGRYSPADIFIVLLATSAGKVNQILFCGQLLEGARWCYTLPAVSCKKVFFFNLINHLLTKLLRSKLLNSVSVYKHRYILTKQAWTMTPVNSRHYRIVCCAYSNSIEGTCLFHYYA